MKFYGAVGFNMGMKESSPGVSVPSIEEHLYSGDVLEINRRWIGSEYLNGNVDVSNQISILADPFALQQFQQIRYVQWMGALWKVTSIKVQYPRLILTIGGVYNGERPET